MLKARADRLTLWLVGLDRYPKRAILAVNDLILFNAGVVARHVVAARRAICSAQLANVPASWRPRPFIGIATFFQLRVLPHGDALHRRRAALMLTAGAVGFSALYWGLLVYFSGVYSVPRSVVVLYPMLATALIWLQPPGGGIAAQGRGRGAPHARARSRADRADLWRRHHRRAAARRPARRPAATGRSASSIPAARSPASIVAGLKVYAARAPRSGSFRATAWMKCCWPCRRRSRRDRQAALRQLEQLKVRVRTLPAIEDVAAGRVTVSDLRPVEADDLLGRDPVPAGHRPAGAQHRGQVGDGDGGRRLHRLGARAPDHAATARSGSYCWRGARATSTKSSWKSRPCCRLQRCSPDRRAATDRVPCSAPSSTAALVRSEHRAERASRPSITRPPSSMCRWSSTIRWSGCATTPSAPPRWPMPRSPAAWSGSC